MLEKMYFIRDKLMGSKRRLGQIDECKLHITHEGIKANIANRKQLTNIFLVRRSDGTNFT
jgi:hypothetical protein